MLMNVNGLASAGSLKDMAVMSSELVGIML